MSEQPRTLSQIFQDHGIDPFDAFLLNEADMPQDARDFLAAQRANREPSIDRIARAAHAVSEHGRFDRHNERYGE